MKRFLAIINAPIFLWLISAIFLTGGAAVFQTRAQCTEQAESALRKNVLAQNELRNRLIYFQQEVLDAKTAQDLQTAIRKRKLLRSNDQQKTIYDLLGEVSEARLYLSPDELGAVLELSLASKLEQWAADAELNGVDEEQFKLLKANIRNTSEPWQFIALIPNCTLWSSAKNALLGTHVFLRYLKLDERPD